jgi:hypothetical protein
MTDERFERACQLIRQRLRASPVEEDAGHAENTLQWLLRLAPDADPALRLAALGHDIERARPNRVQRRDYATYDLFKAAHATIGARILRRLLRQAGMCPDVRKEACRLVLHHEVGGDPRTDLLQDADSISFFDHNLPFYFGREGRDEALRRATWGYKRLSPRGRAHVATLRMPSAVLQKLLQAAAGCQLLLTNFE